MNAWMEIPHLSFYRNLQTTKSARRRGLAKLLVQIYCKRIAERDNTVPTSFIVDGNTASQELFFGLGFETYGRCCWWKLSKVSERKRENKISLEYYIVFITNCFFVSSGIDCFLNAIVARNVPQHVRYGCEGPHGCLLTRWRLPWTD